MSQSIDDELPKALVLTWNGNTLRVQCPYCLYEHGHGFQRPLADELVDRAERGWMLRIKGRRRRSDCSGTMRHDGAVDALVSDLGDGRTLLPQHRKHMDTSVIEDEDEDEDEDNASDDIIYPMTALSLNPSAQGRPTRTATPVQSFDEIMIELYGDPDFRSKLYFSLCIRREIRELELLCQRYPNDRFIGSTNDEGNTGVLFAASEENGLNMVRWLHSHGDNINTANNYGRTPLMEATLWGRLETVKFLVEQHVDLTARDGNNMQAYDFAADTRRNRAERESRASKVYREPSNSATRREQIAQLLLRAIAPVQTCAGAVTTQRNAFFGRTPTGQLEIYRPSTLLDVPSGPYGRQKAFATLDRGPNYPYINAMSGYSHHGWPNVLDNKVWTSKAEKLRAHFGLESDKSAASHVEPQLLAYLLDRHTLHEIEDSDMSERLASAMPILDIQSIITVSKPDLCGPCREFYHCFQRSFAEVRVEFRCVGDSITPHSMV